MATNQAKKTDPNSYRDSISTVDAQGKRIWLYPKKPSGRYYNARKWTSYLLLAFLFGGPFIRIGGEPLLLINVLERKFVILGKLFLPQDFFIFVFTMIMAVIFIVLFTQVYGRIFCGWVCPQTIFMEMVFRRIEYWIEGDANQQRKLASSPWNGEKIVKKGGKHLLFFMISFFIANTFLSYVVGSDVMMEMITHSPAENFGIFSGLVIFTGVFYFVFAYLREQVCTAICPYGRLQGVLLKKDSIVISYDHVRGEPRGKLVKNPTEADSPKGDCIDCGLCVQVCPTGIDIRNGTQLECVNCTACIDACDEVMDKIGKPRGLVRYASELQIEEKTPFRFTARHKIYSGILLVLMAMVAYSLTVRTDIEATILRAQGMNFLKADNGNIRNLYTIQVANKTSTDATLEVRLVEPAGMLTLVGDQLFVKGQGQTEGAFFLEIAEANLTGRSTPIVLEIWEGDRKRQTIKSTFTGPYTFK